jgi:hypothetical protein
MRTSRHFNHEAGARTGARQSLRSYYWWSFQSSFQSCALLNTKTPLQPNLPSYISAFLKRMRARNLPVISESLSRNGKG